jgi:hypothetical protein
MGITPCPTPGQLSGIPLVLPLTRRHLQVYTHFGNPSAERLIRPHLTPQCLTILGSSGAILAWPARCGEFISFDATMTTPRNVIGVTRWATRQHYDD